MSDFFLGSLTARLGDAMDLACLSSILESQI